MIKIIIQSVLIKIKVKYQVINIIHQKNYLKNLIYFVKQKHTIILILKIKKKLK